MAYLRTLAVVLFLPWRAARGLAIPDHWSRGVRWAVVHLVCVTVACALLANGQHFPRWLAAQAWPPSFDPPHMYLPEDAPGGRMIVWFSQSLVAWAIAVTLPVGLASLLSFTIPGRHRAAKLGGVKWSLYLSSLYLVVIAAWCGYCALNAPQAQPPWTTMTYTLPTPSPPVMMLAGAYGAWWAAGMMANPYNRVRTLRAFFGFAVLYAGSWAIVAWVLFPAGALSSVL